LLFKLNGIDIIIFTEGKELSFLQQSFVLGSFNVVPLDFDPGLEQQLLM
jgi:hypothetical protein